MTQYFCSRCGKDIVLALNSHVTDIDSESVVNPEQTTRDQVKGFVRHVCCECSGHSLGRNNVCSDRDAKTRQPLSDEQRANFNRNRLARLLK
jgi:hypothetical protein